MKIATSLILLLATAFAFASFPGLLTKQSRDWQFVQSVGGMKVSVDEGKVLTVDCDVSGLRKVTVKPTMINSGLAVGDVRHRRAGDRIQLTLTTRLIGEGATTTPGPLDLSKYPAGIYTVEYRDPDGALHEIGKVTLSDPKGPER
ncbi:hypothetical protein HAHE_20730 [Haloferula helveola]|uniref:Uncharacterized protein n=1 Tax=Haloferula helveola TaxID=490095 RepID=A0ABM7RKG7_9BACT|nr:hypothetical protein HAHE_20730 [Haloferula helveola]